MTIQDKFLREKARRTASTSTLTKRSNSFWLGFVKAEQLKQQKLHISLPRIRGYSSQEQKYSKRTSKIQWPPHRQLPVTRNKRTISQSGPVKVPPPHAYNDRTERDIQRDKKKYFWNIYLLNLLDAPRGAIRNRRSERHISAPID